MDWKDVVRTVAPALGTLALGPLGGGVVKVLADKVLGGSTGNEAQDEAALQEVLSGPMTPELRAKIIESENAVKTAVIAAGIREKEIEAETERAYLADVQQARTAVTALQTNDAAPWWIKAQQPTLALLAVVGFLACIAGLFAVSFTSAVMESTVKDILIYALGTLTGVVLMIYNFFFGTSDGSRRNQQALAEIAGKKKGP
jgi:hypothetical protein